MLVVVLITLIIIIGQVKVQHRVVNLENKVFSYIGKLSFGLYVYHPLIILIFSKYLKFNFFDSDTLNAVIVFITVLGSSIIISHLSYYYFEKKFLNRKVKFSIIESSNVKEV
ncbi:acyltransferase family protein [Sphingobacterium sp. UDSM-2020]|uniref:acyltransferase family protein n=1 Tax=Sphingobacterium sp. UDSM-2020 TaxID=2795738 RepID=UPI00397DEA33